VNKMREKILILFLIIGIVFFGCTQNSSNHEVKNIEQNLTKNITQIQEQTLPKQTLKCLDGLIVSDLSDCPKPNCLDGTKNKECSTNKSYYCNDGVLVFNALKCGCPEGYMLTGLNCKRGPYTDQDVQSVLALAKSFKSIKESTNWFSENYYSDERNISVITPYSTAVVSITEKAILYDPYSAEDIKFYLESGIFAITAHGIKTETSYAFDKNPEDVRIFIKDGEQLLRPYTPARVDGTFLLHPYYASVTGYFKNFEQIAKKNITILVIIDGKEHNYDLDLSTFK